MGEHKASILIAEDELPLARALAMKLQAAGLDVTTAHDGQEAMEMMKNKKFDLLMLDLIMPKVDGFAVLEHMKKEGIRTPVFIMSNLGQSEDVARAKTYGAVGYFVKADTPLSTITEKVLAQLHAT